MGSVLDMTEEQESKMQKIIKENLEKQRNIGIQIGIVAASKVIYNKLNDSSKTLLDRVADAKKFCKIGLDKEKELISQDKTDNIGDVADDNS